MPELLNKCLSQLLIHFSKVELCRTCSYVELQEISLLVKCRPVQSEEIFLVINFFYEVRLFHKADQNQWKFLPCHTRGKSQACAYGKVFWLQVVQTEHSRWLLLLFDWLTLTCFGRKATNSHNITKEFNIKNATIYAVDGFSLRVRSFRCRPVRANLKRGGL